MSASSSVLPPSRSLLDRALSIISRVEPGEGAGALLMTANVFVLMCAYYIMRPVREALLLSQPGGAEIKSYLSAVLAALFLVLIPLYGKLASKVNRAVLINSILLFFISNLVLFIVLYNAGVKLGIAYFLWIGVFNMLSVAQMWSFANDLYTEEQGKRLFPIIGVGASLGALAGATVVRGLFRQFAPPHIMGIGGAVLLLCVLLTTIVHRRERDRATADKAAEAALPLDKHGGFQLILKNRYLLSIALLALVLNLVNTTGEYILGKFVETEALREIGTGALLEEQRGKFIGQFYGGFYTWVNLFGFLQQTLIVSRLFQWIGVRGALFVLPSVSLCGYGMLASAPVLAIIRWAKILENSTDYSLNNTVRHALYLPTSREAKYKAKAATDTFFVRTGDMLQSAVVYGGTTVGLSVAGFAAVNLVFVGVWLVLALFIFRQHKNLSTET